MILSTCLLAAALVTAVPTNAPAAFSTEAERTFAVPDISERNVWLDVGMGFAATTSNRIEIAFGPDADGDGLLGDDESPFAFALDCGRLVVRDGLGHESRYGNSTGGVYRVTLQPARNGTGDSWKIVDGASADIVSGVFPDELVPVATWRLVRVRLNGPEVAEARISLQRNRHATVFLVR